MSTYRDLDIYKESKKLAIEVHSMSMCLPKFELYEQGSQIRRSSKAIASAIVEGYGRRRYRADFVKYLIYAQAECDETILHLEFLFDTKSLLNEELFNGLRSQYVTLSKRINNFTKWTERNHPY